jgi:hypothetical protein
MIAEPLAGVADVCDEPIKRIPTTAIPTPTATESLIVIVFSLVVFFRCAAVLASALNDGNRSVRELNHLGGWRKDDKPSRAE